MIKIYNKNFTNDSAFQSFSKLFNFIVTKSKYKKGVGIEYDDVLEYIRTNGPLCTTDLYIHFRVDQTYMSQVLRILKNLNLVTTERQGKFIYYKINKENGDNINNLNRLLDNIEYVINSLNH